MIAYPQQSAAATCAGVTEPPPRAWPTLVHVTHGKAGSQWVHKILRWLAPGRCLRPAYECRHFTHAPILPGHVYPTVYLPHEAFRRVRLPYGATYFVVIRDLRDTLVSWYFSMRYSHVADHPAIAEVRDRLGGLGVEDGMLWATEESAHFASCARVQRTWQAAGEPLVRYEELLQRDEEVFEEVLLERCRLPVSRQELAQAVRGCRFERLTGGRPRGREDVGCHERKGVAGDWRNYFTGRLADAFKARFGDVLVATGYERDQSW
jgi:lipopolysaccharide transport system ATP-binding protein